MSSSSLRKDSSAAVATSQEGTRYTASSGRKIHMSAPEDFAASRGGACTRRSSTSGSEGARGSYATRGVERGEDSSYFTKSSPVPKGDESLECGQPTAVEANSRGSSLPLCPFEERKKTLMCLDYACRTEGKFRHRTPAPERCRYGRYCYSKKCLRLHPILERIKHQKERAREQKKQQDDENLQEGGDLTDGM